MKKYQFIKGWMTDGQICVDNDGETSMYNKEGELMRFRQIEQWEIAQWLRDDMLKEI